MATVAAPPPQRRIRALRRRRTASLKDSVAFWTAILDGARTDGNDGAYARAEKNLARLGIRITFLRPRRRTIAEIVDAP